MDKIEDVLLKIMLYILKIKCGYLRVLGYMFCLCI